jgi:hypothetical protein
MEQSMNATSVRIALAAIAAAGLLGSTGASAADSVTVTVSANVSGVCKFNSGQTPTVVVANSGANIDPSSGTTATGNANVLYRCTNGTTPTFTVPSPATITCQTSGTCGSTTMAATMTFTSGGAGAGFTTDKTLVVTGTILPAIFQVAQAGPYSGTILVSVSP